MNDDKLEVGGQVVHFKSSESMDEVGDGTVDVIVTSPPYNRGKHYSDDYDDSMPDEDYYGMLEKVFVDCHRVLSKDGLFFLNIGDGAADQGKSEKVVGVAVGAGFRRLQTIAWVKSIFGKGHYTPTGGSRRLNNVWENVFVLYKTRKYKIEPKAVGIPYTDTSNVDRFASGSDGIRDAGNVWFVPYSVTTGKTVKKGHEAPFPVGLPYRCIKLVPGATRVLDPFAGAGSTLAACRYLNVSGIGYELYPNKELITSTIMDDFAPDSPVLIGKLESLVGMYAEWLGKLIDPMPYGSARVFISRIGTQRVRDAFCMIDELELSIPDFINYLLASAGYRVGHSMNLSEFVNKKEPGR